MPRGLPAVAMRQVLGAPPVERWTVRKDGGEFDQFAGATITPRAVVVAVRKALEYHAGHRDQLYREQPSGLPPLPQ